jgi:RimJ/RimL family protein N-acetyltransferase
MLTRITKPTERPVAGLDEIVLEDGTRLRVRPIEPGDRDSFAALFDALSLESRRRRFLSPKPALTAGQLKYLTDVDHVNHEALAAIDETSGAIVGVSRYAAYQPGAGVAEVAFEVADALQGRGVGAALAERVVRRARENGFERLVATTLWENLAARALLRRLGFSARRSGGAELELELELEPLGAQAVAA